MENTRGSGRRCLGGLAAEPAEKAGGRPGDRIGGRAALTRVGLGLELARQPRSRAGIPASSAIAPGWFHGRRRCRRVDQPAAPVGPRSRRSRRSAARASPSDAARDRVAHPRDDWPELRARCRKRGYETGTCPGRSAALGGMRSISSCQSALASAARVPLRPPGHGFGPRGRRFESGRADRRGRRRGTGRARRAGWARGAQPTGAAYGRGRRGTGKVRLPSRHRAVLLATRGPSSSVAGARRWRTPAPCWRTPPRCSTATLNGPWPAATLRPRPRTAASRHGRARPRGGCGRSCDPERASS